MTTESGEDHRDHGRGQGTDPETLQRHFGTADGLLPLWIAEPRVELAPGIREALRTRAETGWYGYEVRPPTAIEAFWDWTIRRHGWDGSEQHTLISPSVGTSIGVLVDQLTSPGEGVILQPPVYTDFKPIVTAADRRIVRNPLMLTADGYRIDFDDLTAKAADPATRLLILCNPHNPVGRVWTLDELRSVASICSEHDVFVLADEIHADLAIAPHRFVPFAAAAAESGVVWAATHGPIKTFGLAGVCDSLLITPSDEVADRFDSTSSKFRLNRNNVFGLAAFEAAYRTGMSWHDDFMAMLVGNVDALRRRLPEEIDLLRLEGTYLAWLDLRRLGLEVAEIPTWLASSAGLALSPGHWFGREGAGFARMTIAGDRQVIEQAADQLAMAAARRQRGS